MSPRRSNSHPKHLHVDWDGLVLSRLHQIEQGHGLQLWLGLFDCFGLLLAHLLGCLFELRRRGRQRESIRFRLANKLCNILVRRLGHILNRV